MCFRANVGLVSPSTFNHLVSPKRWSLQGERQVWLPLFPRVSAAQVLKSLFGPLEMLHELTSRKGLQINRSRLLGVFPENRSPRLHWNMKQRWSLGHFSRGHMIPLKNVSTDVRSIY